MLPGGWISMKFVVPSKYVPQFPSDDGQLSHFNLQTEPETSADIGVRDADNSVSNIHATVSEVQNQSADPHTATSNIDCSVLDNHEDADDEDPTVRTTHPLLTVKSRLITT